MKVQKLCFLLTLFIVMGSACATSFKGDAHSDRAKCEKKCQIWEMELSGMVSMGEYTSGCVCRIRNSSQSKSLNSIEEAAAINGGVAGVMMQMQRARANGHHHH
jgi:hypothetical protein